MIESPYREIIDGLVKSTKAKKITWFKTSTQNEFKANLPSGSVSVWVDQPEDIFATRITLASMPKADFVIYNQNGDEVHKVQVNNRESVEYDEIYGLHGLAKQSYLRSDETISGLLNDLGQLE